MLSDTAPVYKKHAAEFAAKTLDATKGKSTPTKPGSKSTTPPAGSRGQAGFRSATLDGMLKRGEPITRENFIANNWGDMPDPWTAEHEQEMPPDLREGGKSLTKGPEKTPEAVLAGLAGSKTAGP
jgi:hypothetical protein